jgi:hypothetical protein
MNIEQEIQNILDRNFTRGDNAKALKELLVLYNVVGRSEQLVNFLWEQYKIHRIITKKAYMTMVANARKINQ